MTSKDGNGVFQVIPWWRSTRINYDGDLTTTCSASRRTLVRRNLYHVRGAADGSGSGQGNCTTSACSQTHTRATSACELPISARPKNHAWKIGIDTDREFLVASQAFACYYQEGCGATYGTHDQPYYLAAPPEQGQAGSQIGIYGEDSWHLSNNVLFNYGLRYDHSTGYTSGSMISPRLGLNLWDGGKKPFTFSTAASTPRHCSKTCVRIACFYKDARASRCTTFSRSATPTPKWVGNMRSILPSPDRSISSGRPSVNILDTTQLLNTPLFAVFNNAIGIDNGAELRLQDRCGTTISGGCR